MASDEAMTFHFSSQDEDFDDDIDDGYDHHQHPLTHNLSRLSVCTSSTLCGVDDDDDGDVDDAMTMYLSRLSVQSFEGDGDADGEIPDGKELLTASSTDSENELGSCYSLPGTPTRRRNRVGVEGRTPVAVKYYASDNETEKGVSVGEKTKNNSPWWRKSWRSRRIKSDRDNNQENSEKISNKKEEKEEEHVIHGFSGESDQSGSGGTGLMVITRPKGGRRSLCMDMEEVKACRDLGFELEHERMLEVPSRLSLSNSTLDTSSGGNSPISNWRISSPGDDPRDVKARLKVWAQAVAIASTSKYGS